MFDCINAVRLYKSHLGLDNPQRVVVCVGMEGNNFSWAGGGGL